MQSTFHLLLTLDKPSEQHFQVLSKVRLTKSCCWNPALFSLSPPAFTAFRYFKWVSINHVQTQWQEQNKNWSLRFLQCTKCPGVNWSNRWGWEGELSSGTHPCCRWPMISQENDWQDTVFLRGWCIPALLRKHNSQLGLPPCFHSDHSHAILYLLTRQLTFRL